MGEDLVSSRKRSWTDLPMEILAFIAIRLPLLELLSFRGTCKDFRSASTTSTAKIESSTKPWLLFHQNNSKYTIYNEDGSKTYNRLIPDLNDATCLASYQGWLLLFKHESMFFFSPFSFFKIPLPDFPHKQIDGHVGAFSNPPTSNNCVVSVINRIENLCFEINMISKGQNMWTQHIISSPPGRDVGLDNIFSGATFDDKEQEFYYMYGESRVLTFSVKDNKWKPYKIVVGEKYKDVETLPYIYKEDKFSDRFEEKMHALNLEDDEYVDVCGLTYEPETCNRIVYLNEAINVSPTKTRKRKAVWIQPRFFEAQKDLHW